MPRLALRALGTIRHAEPLVPVGTRIPKALRQRVRLSCADQDRQVQDFVAEALREYLRHRRRRG